MENVNVGTQIRAQREKLGMKVYELARIVGVDPVYITQIEKHNKLPSIVVYMNIERALKLPPALRHQYYREKNPEVTKRWPVQEIDDLFSIPKPGKSISLVEKMMRYTDKREPKDVRSFIIGFFNDLEPNYKLTEDEIKEYIKMIQYIAEHKWLYRAEQKKLFERFGEVNRFEFPKIGGDVEPEYLKWGF